MFRLAALAVAALSASVASATISCGSTGDSNCPSDAPCCSQYGECGVGAYCLGGCDPRYSFSLDSCTPEPICESKSFDSWDNLDSLAKNYDYLGNASDYDWVYSGTLLTDNGDLVLTMPNNSGGALVSYNHYIWYGKVSGTFKTSRDAGVITAFILLSDVKDEIDYEFVGANLTTAQTNYYFQGILDYDNAVNGTISSDSFENFHTYELDWTPDSITWYLDGESIRVLNRNETYNSTTNQYEYPQTPARLELSLWPGGASNQGEGTITWAGGPINWDSQDMQDPGYYYAIFRNISITCYDPPSGANIQGNNSYIYTSYTVTNNTVEIVNNATILNNFDDTGLNMTAGSSTATATSATNTAVSVPSSNGGGSGAESNQGSSTSSGSHVSSTGFSQGGSTQTGAAAVNEHVFQSSIFAVLVAVIALVVL
ncbi:putative glycosidase crf2 [Talaromyces atroroseus]|uniref:Crh-like protein n=1 Tax=Talaromyces atroroseus TaxID=1441469 RepID=A0A225ACF8_TALAT|nr:putative glycosidase crf2 [Talaromyces atroroseus]OKL56553.1 putative glycosidase crf2 [Talaromyces atroroseus]